MTNHVDASTPQGDTLRPVLTCLQNIREEATRDALVREVFADGSGVEPSAFCGRINQHAYRVGVSLNVPTPKSEDTTGLEILHALLELACHPLLLRSLAEHHCHEVCVRMVTQLLRSGALSDPHTEYILWYSSHRLTQ